MVVSGAYFGPGLGHVPSCPSWDNFSQMSRFSSRRFGDFVPPPRFLMLVYLLLLFYQYVLFSCTNLVLPPSPSTNVLRLLPLFLFSASCPPRSGFFGLAYVISSANFGLEPSPTITFVTVPPCFQIPSGHIGFSFFVVHILVSFKNGRSTRWGDFPLLSSFFFPFSQRPRKVHSCF